MFKLTHLSILLVSSLLKPAFCIEVCPYEEEQLEGIKYIDFSTATFMAIIFLWNEGYEGGFKFCSGVVINSTHVLTSGQCLLNTRCVRQKETKQFDCVMVEASKYDIIVGQSYVLSPEKPLFRKGKEIKIHPNFTEHRDYSYNFASIEMDTPIDVPNNYDKNSTYNRKYMPDEYSVYYTYKNWFRGGINGSLITFGSNPCSSVFTKSVRKYYQIGLDKFQRLKIIRLIEPNVTFCEEMYSAYYEAGFILDKYNVICYKTKFKNPDCEDISGSILVEYPTVRDQGNYIYGFVLPLLSCNMNQHLFIVRVGPSADFFNGYPTQVDSIMK